LTFKTDKAAAFSSVIVATTRMTATEARPGIIMGNIRRGLSWEPINTTTTSPSLNQWPTWSRLSFDGGARFLSDDSTTQSARFTTSVEESIRKQVLPNIPQYSFELEEMVATYDVNKRLRLYAFLIEATITKEFRDGKKDGRISASEIEAATLEIFYSITKTIFAL